jgi:copper(I)-binding protein
VSRRADRSAARRGVLVRLRAAAAVALLVLLGGCVRYPTVVDIGGVNVRGQNGRAVRDGDRLRVYFDLVSTGKFGDAITAVSAPVARRAQLVDATGGVLTRFEIPGTATVKLAPEGPHVVLTDFARPLIPRETFIVTLVLEKSGGLGVVTVVE